MPKKVDEIKKIKSKLNKYIVGRLRNWVKDVKERDLNTCQRCGNKEKLEVHHSLIPLRQIIHETIKNFHNLDLNIKENFYFIVNIIVKFHIPEIGITLCDKCHLEVDKCKKYF